nr:MAG TPA: bacterial RNA polymerase [Bacteriophage sp.]
MDIEKLNLSVRTYNAFKRAGINTVEDYINNPDKDKLNDVVGSKAVNEFLAASGNMLPVPQGSAEEIAETFNYAVLSAEMGDYLRRKEEQLKNEYMSFTANCGRIFAEAQEKLAGSNQYNGLFEKWITAMGFAKRSVYRMIQIYEYRSCQIGTSEGKRFFDALPKTLQADISAPSAPAELVEQVMSGDITTHKEYIELKKQLESQKQSYKKVLEENQELRRDRVNAMNMAERKEMQVADLEKQVRELESRPRDVAVQSDPKDAERIAALEKEIEELRSQPTDFDFGETEAPGTLDDDQLSELYETLHGKVQSALKDCKAFIGIRNLPQAVRDRALDRFKTLEDLIRWHIEEMEE